MELDLAEQLWQAGVVEGDFLALVALAIAGPGAEVDPGWRWFGGSIDHVPQLEPLQAWACAELDTARDAALARIAPGVTPLAATAFPGVDGLVARAAAALCTVFCARLGCEPDLDRVRAAVAIRGRLVLGDPLRVVMAMDAIDIEIRRVGLDLDPGYLPWLRHKVVLVFEEPNH
jgi:hypothetical protein